MVLYNSGDMLGGLQHRVDEVKPYFTYFSEVPSVDVSMGYGLYAFPLSLASCEFLGYLLKVRVLLEILKFGLVYSFLELE